MGSFGYNFSSRDFDGVTPDYSVQDINAGITYVYSSDLSLSLGAGYFSQKVEDSNNQDGYTYNISLARSWERVNFNVGGNGGWDESYLDAERRGFTRYSGLNLGLDYRLLEELIIFINGAYRYNRDSENLKWISLQGTWGINWNFSRRFSLSVNYTYSERDDDDNLRDYRANRMMFSLTGSRLFRW